MKRNDAFSLKINPPPSSHKNFVYVNVVMKADYKFTIKNRTFCLLNLIKLFQRDECCFDI